MIRGGLQEIVWPRPEEILEVAKTRDLSSEELLALKSASFFGPIKLFGIAKGKKEVDKEPYVRTGYNCLRELDEGEDASNKRLSVDDKTFIINKLKYVIGEVVRMNGNGGKIEELIRGNDFRTVTEMIINGAVNPDETVNDKARTFVEHFGRGVVLRELYGYDKSVREAIDYCVRSMGDGMIQFLQRGPIQTEEQLNDYCYHVAGRIGSGLLNKLIKLKDVDSKGRPIILDDAGAEKAGEFLQLVNILKNVRMDYEEGRRFFPQQFLPREISFEYMINGKGLDASDARRTVLDRVLKLAEGKFGHVVEYGISIPPNLSGYKSFFIVPVITAKKTIENIRLIGAESLFRGEQKAIKIPYGIKDIMQFSYNLATYEDGQHANKWLDAFANKPEDFPFDPEGFRDWSSSWLGNIAA